MVFLCFSKGLFQVISIFLSKVCYSIVQRVLSVLMIDKVDTTSGLSLKLLRGAWLLQILPMPIFQQHHMNSQMASMFSMPPSNMYLKLLHTSLYLLCLSTSLWCYWNLLGIGQDNWGGSRSVQNFWHHVQSYPYSGTSCQWILVGIGWCPNHGRC